MTSDQRLRAALRRIESDEAFSQAVLHLADGSRLCFCHRVDERWAKAVGTDDRPDDGGVASDLLAEIATFRLNAKHLDISFRDQSRWDERLQDLDVFD